jgi:hypothetical protein
MTNGFRHDPLLVPINVEAMVLNTPGVNFIRAQVNYDNLASCRSPSPAPFQQDQANFADSVANHGVYLHWTLPAALRHAVQSADGSLQFPFVPNRWLVARTYRAATAEGASPPTVAAWVVESDALGTSGGANYVDPTNSSLTQIGLGRKVPITPERPWVEPTPHPYFLRAVAEGNPAFAAYQPFNTNVFSIHDDLRTQGLAAGTVSYFVLGWYSDASADPLAAWPHVGFAELLADLGWTASEAPGTSQSIYHGAAVGVPWDPSPPGPPQSPRDRLDPQISVGNTSVDAVVAFAEAALSAPGVSLPDDLPPEHAADLLEAFQYNLLSLLDQPDGHEDLEQAIRAQWFASAHGGRAWTIVDAPAAPGAAPERPSPEQLAAEANWLDALNAAQAQYDETSRRLMSVQRRLFELWWKQQAMGAIKNDQGEYPWKVTPRDFSAALDPTDPNGLVAQARSMLRQLDQLAQQIPVPAHEASLERAVVDFQQDRNLPSSRALKAIAAPRFWMASDPVMVLSGTAHTIKLDPDDTLACRSLGELVTAVELNAGPSGPSFTASSREFVDLASSIPWSGLPAAAPALFSEFLLLDPTNAALAAAVAGMRLSADQLSAVASSLASTTLVVGARPALSPPFPWAQPWQPLFLDWELTWFPVPFVNDQGGRNWLFNGNDYDLAAQPAEPPPTPLNGRSLLTPKPSFEFRSRIEQFIDENQDSVAARELKALEDLIDTVDGWDFLSQTLSGLSLQLASWSPVPTLRPPATPLEGGTESLADLIGDHALSPPNPELARRGRGEPPRSAFEGLRAGQFYISRLAVVDRFGQTFEIVTTQTAPQSTVLQGHGLAPAPPILQVEPSRLVQLPPRLLQPARLDFRFVPDATGSPILGWVVPDHLDGALAVYGKDGTLYGELGRAVGAEGPFLKWWSAPDSPYPSLAQLATDQPSLGGFLTALQAAGPLAMEEFVRSVDETLWTVDPLGERADPYLSVLLGRPLAVAAASIAFELQSAAYRDLAWPHTFNQPPPRFLDYRFPVRLGQLASRRDGLLGYFLDGNYARFNAVHVAQPAPGDPPPSGYLAPIGTDNWIELQFEASGVGPVCALTLLIDPRASVHAHCGILPTKEIMLLPEWVDDALGAIKASFRVGPVLAEERMVAPEPGATAVNTLLLPTPAERGGTWLWRQQEADGSWRAVSVGPADAAAALPDTPPILRHGALEWTGGLEKNGH